MNGKGGIWEAKVAYYFTGGELILESNSCKVCLFFKALSI
jgi:hypothetical protein